MIIVIVTLCICRIGILKLFVDQFHSLRMVAAVYPITWSLAMIAFIICFCGCKQKSVEKTVRKSKERLMEQFTIGGLTAKRRKSQRIYIGRRNSHSASGDTDLRNAGGRNSIDIRWCAQCRICRIQSAIQLSHDLEPDKIMDR